MSLQVVIWPVVWLEGCSLQLLIMEVLVNEVRLHFMKQGYINKQSSRRQFCLSFQPFLKTGFARPTLVSMCPHFQVLNLKRQAQGHVHSKSACGI